MSWPELLKARKNLQTASYEVDKLLKNHSSFTKKEIARQEDVILAEFDKSFDIISEQMNEFLLNIKNHRKYIMAKSSFINRHYKRI